MVGPHYGTVVLEPERYTRDHPFTPGQDPGICSVFGCWGWVDDMRHLRFTRNPRAVMPPLIDRKTTRHGNPW